MLALSASAQTASSSEGPRQTGSLFKEFLQRTTLGVHCQYGVGLPNTVTNGIHEYSDYKRWGIGATWMYNITSHWSAGIGATYMPNYSYTWTHENAADPQIIDHDKLSDDDLDAFLRLGYTSDWSAIRPYAYVDFGTCSNSYFVYRYYAAQIGIHLTDWLKLGASYSTEAQFYDHNTDTRALNFVLSVDF